MPEWQKLALTVDSGALDTTVPPHTASHLPLLPGASLGTEVAHGSVAMNLGERQAEIKLGETHQASFLMSFQVVEVHKPLWVVSRLAEAGHHVILSKKDPHILMADKDKAHMNRRGGT